ncbi:liprin-alpha-1-like [Bubalus kerabau]|uniref:liprin-alpha-1-like n=1 Tax=Bubalus carabanensis TaxID=3119969 RepID=UPI00244ED1C6|nr:liprin-alpha-1-like [Bubalus carabanensis]
MEERLAALSAHMKHLEEDLDTARKDLLQSKDRKRKLERDVREIFQSKEEIALLLRWNLLFGNVVDQLDTLATWYPM